MDLKIFDVEHGACALLTCDNGTRMMIDCGHNGDNGWRPGNYLRERGIHSLDMLAITNYDEDHVSGLKNLRERVDIGWLLRNKSVNSGSLRELKSEDGMGSGIDQLAAMFPVYTSSGTTESPPPVFKDVEKKVFYHDYPEFDDENNLSMVLYLSIAGINFLFPGDLEKAGWLALFEQSESFKSAVAKTHVLIASHHGRDNGICEDVFDKHGCKPYFTVISDKGYQYDTQKTVPYYRSKSRGATINGENRHVFTTRADGCIRFWFAGGKWGVEPGYDIEQEKL